VQPSVETGPARALRVLLVEDSPEDAVLVVRFLARGPFQVQDTRVQDGPALRAALAEQSFDLVLCDFELPTLDAFEALAIVRGQDEDLPFIVVSGRIGEDVAVETVRRGANDYLLKSNLTRLPVAVERALGEAEQKRDRAAVREQLVVAERMATVGNLAAGLVHEINNPLSALLFNLEYIADSLARESGGGLTAAEVRGLQQPLAEAREACGLVMAIAADVKMFARRVEPQHRAVSLAEVVDSAARLARMEMRRRARFVREFAEVPLVRGDRARLAQVFLNLILNAAQAIPEGRPDANQIRAVLRSAGPGQVVLEISDTGSGIPPEVLARLQRDLAFTTKGDKGTGLGLTICRRILDDLGGSLEMESQPGKGTTVRVYLPAERERVAVSAPEVAAPVQRSSILVVDDDPMILRAIERALLPRHDPTCVQHARDALALIGRPDLRFDAVVCDLMLPGMSGMDFHAELEQLAPRLAAATLFLTNVGYSDRARSFLSSHPQAFLEKPFQTDQLLRAVGRLVA
jgi:signal transduction histidine kinase